MEQFWADGNEPDEDGIESAFELEYEVSEKVQTGLFVGDCFVYTNRAIPLYPQNRRFLACKPRSW